MADNRVYEKGALPATPPSMPVPPSTGYPTNGDPVAGTPATVPGAQWFHQIGEELRAVIEAAGLAPSSSDLGQMLAAMQLLFAHLDANGEVTQSSAGASAQLAAGLVDSFRSPAGTWINVGETVVNANGTAIKFADGSMICRGALLLTTTTSNSWVFNNISFPASFITSTGLTVVTGQNASSGQASQTSAAIVSNLVVQLGYLTSSTPHGVAVSYMALGRWK